MIRIVCVCTDTKYSLEYVAILEDMIARNFAGDYLFECFTDRYPDQLNKIERVLFRPAFGFGGWWDKIGLLQPGLWPEGERIWYFDLDTVIVGELDKIFAYDGPFAAIGDFYVRGALQSCVMTWRAGEMDGGLNFWEARDRFQPVGGDQAVIQQYAVNWIDLRSKFPGVFVSYREDARDNPPPDAKVIAFHGQPKPHQIKAGWVLEIWKLGGGTAAMLVPTGNLPPRQIAENILWSCLSRPERWDWLTAATLPRDADDDTAVIVGGGPSLEQQLPVLKALTSQADVTIIALNAAAQWCNDHGIIVHMQLMVDPRPEMAAMIVPPRILYEAPIRCYASQCDPAVTAKADFLFHAFADGVFEMVPKGAAGRSDLFVGGGSSVGLVAMSFAYLVGFRKLHLFGYDSSFVGGRHHAYDQPLNDGQSIITATLGDISYLCAPWMAKQVQEYQGLAPQLMTAGCEITVHGHGLLPATHVRMCQSVVAADQRAAAILRRLNGSEALVGVEVGVFTGELSARLLIAKPELVLNMVDTWAPYEASEADWHARQPAKHHEAAMRTAQDRVAPFGERARMLRLPSITAADAFHDRTLDFVFIDACHDYEAVRADLTAWAPKVKPGGWLGGHDFNNEEYDFPGVMRAVTEWMGDRPLELDDNYTWFTRL